MQNSLFGSFYFVPGIEETVKLVRAAGGMCYGYVCDLCDRADIYKKAKIIREKIGKVMQLRVSLNLFYEKIEADTTSRNVRTCDSDVLRAKKS